MCQCNRNNHDRYIFLKLNVTHVYVCKCTKTYIFQCSQIWNVNFISMLQLWKNLTYFTWLNFDAWNISVNCNLISFYISIVLLGKFHVYIIIILLVLNTIDRHIINKEIPPCVVPALGWKRIMQYSVESYVFFLPWTTLPLKFAQFLYLLNYNGY